MTTRTIDADQPSRTAIAVARHRAAHQLIDAPLVFTDPLALRVLPPKSRDALEADPRSFEHRPFAAGLRAHLVARSRVAEDALARAVAAGVRQYVVLGAGLDTFSWRNPHPDLRVFEVDRPSTQGLKRRVLAAGGLAEPPNATFVPVDFERDRLDAALAAAGFSANEPAFFSWLGVVPYLTEPVIWSTLEWIARMGDGVAFDYGAPAPWWNLVVRAAARALRARVAAVGEPFRTVMTPAHVADGLRRSGFAAFEDLDRAALVRRYFAGRRDGLAPGALGHVVVAGPRL